MADVRVSGPVFDGRAAATLARACEAIERDVAAQGYSLVMGNLNASIRHPTPYYETQINVAKIGAYTSVNDRRIIYGPWLEGTGSRNRTTRFKGYFSFRRAVEKLRTQARAIAEHTLAPYIRSIT